ncbi:hypothetical protein AAG570_004462 [Ranatra chinensis]|uniref:Uncharacterized protein n=1 Tax=Ranatra chinensis TaxID=642074 RepID=A0ABD0YMP8_9HEMI
MGESYYKSAIDGLDKKRGLRAAMPSLTRSRPSSVSDIDAVFADIGRSAAKAAAEEADDALADTLRRIRAARAAAVPTPQESFEAAFYNRREDVKRRFSEKMLDTVGINGVTEEDAVGSIIAKRRAARVIREAEEMGGLPVKWTALKKVADEEASAIEAAGAAAEARALRSRARLADLEQEMSDIEARGAARERRVAALRSLMSVDDSMMSSSSSSKMSSSMKKMSMTATTTRTAY